MLDSIILSHITFGYFAAFVCYLLMMLMNKSLLGRFATIVTGLTFISHTVAIALRWIKSYEMGIGHAPFSNLYESLVFFAWTIILFYLIIEWRIKNKTLGVFITPLAFLAIAYASFSPNINNSIQPLVPALKSNWLIVHVVTCFFGYAAFGISFGLSLLFLYKRSKTQGIQNILLKLTPHPATIDDLNYQMVTMGFIMMSLGIITGSVWAHSAWGSYWSWDPKETWSLITWLVYAAVLHSRLVRGWKGKRIAILCIVGFSCVLFTYFGVNYLAGLHSYAKT